MNPRKPPYNFGLLLMALMVALVMQLWPLFGGVAMWRPHFVLLVLTFALLHRPDHYGIGTAWCVGLIMDVVYGGVFGRHALALGVCAYLLQLLRPRLLHARLWHQSSLVLLLVAIAQLIVVSVNLSARHSVGWAVVWYPAIISALLWPLLYKIMNRLVSR